MAEQSISVGRDGPAGPGGTGGVLERVFKVHERGSTVAREARGGLATFFTMAYILVLNPIILGGAKDKYGHQLDHVQLVTSTAVVGGVMTLVMGIGGNLPLAIATGLGLQGVVAFTIAPTMSWPDAMGLVVLEGLGICLLVVSGLRQKIMDAIPLALKRAIGVGLGMFVCLIGLVDAGFVTKGSGVPVTLGTDGTLKGWPVAVFCVGVLLTLSLLVRRVPGAILISIFVTTVLAIIVEKSATIAPRSWGLIQPDIPKKILASPDFGLLGKFSLFGGFQDAGVMTALIFVFTLILADFFDAMGTIIGISGEAGLLDEDGRLPRIGRVLFIDGLAASAGGAGSSSSATCFVESAAGVGEGARTGLANVFTGGLLLLAAFLTPIATVVPSQAATPALVAVGFLMMTQAKDIPWDDWEISIPAFLTIVLMPFTFSITNGLGSGIVTYVLIKVVVGKVREVNALLWIVAALFLIYFALDPIKQLFGIK